MALDPTLADLRNSGSWRALTAVPKKFEYFSTESYFRESWAIATAVLGERVLPVLQRLAVITLKPEGVLGRKARTLISYMADHGFRVILAKPFSYDRANTREIWRFQWNIATLDRLALGDALHTQAQSLMLFFLDERTDEPVPASVRVAGLKGSSLPWERQPDQLRSVLGGLNRMIVFVHCSDEPIDIIRELGIIFPAPTLVDIYDRVQSLSAEATANIASEVSSIHARFPEKSLSLEDAREELIRDIPTLSDPISARVITAVEAAHHDSSLDWRQWSADLRTVGINPVSWPAVLIASHYIQHDKPDTVCIISESGRERWLAGAGLFLDPTAAKNLAIPKIHYVG